jgi:hypothetical protein
MAELKTKRTEASVDGFIAGTAVGRRVQRRRNGLTLCLRCNTSLACAFS